MVQGFGDRSRIRSISGATGCASAGNWRNGRTATFMMSVFPAATSCTRPKNHFGGHNAAWPASPLRRDAGHFLFGLSGNLDQPSERAMTNPRVEDFSQYFD